MNGKGKGHPSLMNGIKVKGHPSLMNVKVKGIHHS